MPLLLSSVDLEVRYRGGVSALRGVSLDVPGSGITCLVGANGAGKTTLLETAAGLVQPTSGQLRVLGRAPGCTANRAQLGVMLQDGGLPGSARPREFLEYVARLYPRPRDVSTLLQTVGIDAATRTPIRRLSGGEQRRVSWAAAMVGSPTALLLDEPTAGLDPIGRQEMHDVLRSHADEGVSMIVSTHLIEDVEALADFVVVLKKGAVALSGMVDELRPRTGALVRCSRQMDEAVLLAALPAGSTCRRLADMGYRVDVPSGIDPAVMATVASWCNQHSVMPDIAIADLQSVLWDAIRVDAP